MTVALETRSPHARPGRHRINRPRTLHLLDVENLVTGEVSTRSVTTMWNEFAGAVDPRWDDLSTVAESRRHAATTFFALPSGVRRIVGANGRGGAVSALIESVDVDWARRNFGRVVIGSGHHIFAPLADQLTAQGLQVVQVTGGGGCSAVLSRACDGHLSLPCTRRAVASRQCA